MSTFCFYFDRYSKQEVQGVRGKSATKGLKVRIQRDHDNYAKCIFKVNTFGCDSLAHINSIDHISNDRYSSEAFLLRCKLDIFHLHNTLHYMCSQSLHNQSLCVPPACHLSHIKALDEQTALIINLGSLSGRISVVDLNSGALYSSTSSLRLQQIHLLSLSSEVVVSSLEWPDRGLWQIYDALKSRWSVCERERFRTTDDARTHAHTHLPDTLLRTK